ncbi:MAG: tetratricopeptide repeat protein [Bacteroidales bacterium]|nr:tetratricopeptide repeat protein [Bacteroidales bacterium]
MKKNTFLYILKVLLVVISGLLYISCSSQEDKQLQRQKDIKAYAEKINSNPIALTASNADTLISLYESYINDYPDDSMSEYYLFQMHNVYAAKNQCDSALYCLNKIIKDYPKGKNVGAAYFFKGVVLNDVCLNRDESIKAFEEYIRRYPNNPHVETARRIMQLDTMNNPIDLISNSND